MSKNETYLQVISNYLEDYQVRTGMNNYQLSLRTGISRESLKRIKIAPSGRQLGMIIRLCDSLEIDLVDLLRYKSNDEIKG